MALTRDGGGTLVFYVDGAERARCEGTGIPSSNNRQFLSLGATHGQIGPLPPGGREPPSTTAHPRPTTGTAGVSQRRTPPIRPGCGSRRGADCSEEASPWPPVGSFRLHLPWAPSYAAD